MEARRGYTGKTESCHVSLQFDIAFSWKIAASAEPPRNDGRGEVIAAGEGACESVQIRWGDGLLQVSGT